MNATSETTEIKDRKAILSTLWIFVVLNHAANRWANIVMGVVFSAFVFATLLPGRPPAFYAFLSAAEIAATLFIVWYSWTWPKPADQKST